MPFNMGNLHAMSQMVLDSINEGVYVTDKDRTIQYWAKRQSESLVGLRAR